jgi:hypothetical protein
MLNLATLKKKRTSSFALIPFASGLHQGKTFGEKENGSIFVLVQETRMNGLNKIQRKAVVNINDEDIIELIKAGLEPAEFNSLVWSMFDKPSISIKKTLTPQWEGQEPSLDKNGNILLSADNQPVYTSTQLVDGGQDIDLTSVTTNAPIDAEAVI